MVKFRWVRFLSKKTCRRTKRKENHCINGSPTVEMIIDGIGKYISDNIGDTSQTCWEEAIRR